MRKLLLKEIPDPYLKTLIELPQRTVVDDFNHRFFLIGSCFARNIGSRLNELGISAYYNRYSCNHYSVSSLLAAISRVSREVSWESLVIHDPAAQQAVSLVHSDLRATSTDTLIGEMTMLEKEFQAQLKSADTIVVTLGCATYLTHRNGTIMSAGNGLSNTDYQVVTPSYDNVRKDLQQLYRLIKNANPESNVVFTVSPQRYSWNILDHAEGEVSSNVNDRLLHSNLDKYKLRLAISELDFDNSDSDSYFPSYEIVMDELRSYESFNHDLADSLHVNREFTPNYVINRFLAAYCSGAMQDALEFFSTLLTPNTNRLYKRLHFASSQQQDERVAELLVTAASHLQSVRCHELFSKLLTRVGFLGRDRLRKITLELAAEVRETVECALVSNAELPMSALVPMKKPLTGNIVVWGTGEMMLKILPMLRQCRVLCLVDSKASTDHVFGIPVIAPCELKRMGVVDGVVIASLSFEREIREQIDSMNLKPMNITSARQLLVDR